MKHVQTRWSCPVCGTAGWWCPSTHIGPNPITDHDTPNGKRCRPALAEIARKCFCSRSLLPEEGIENNKDVYVFTRKP